MSNLIEIIIISALSMLLVIAIADSIRLRLNRRLLVRNMLQLSIEKIALENRLLELSMSPSETEGFIKFLSESREWAFSYIEDVQLAIVNLQREMEKSGEAEIEAAYKKLLQFLPDQKPNN